MINTQHQARLIDEIDISFKAGHGGPGRVSFVPHNPHGGPDGGDGGHGGDVYIRTTTDLTALKAFSNKKVVEAVDGEMGGKNKRNGAAGADIMVELPLGSILTEKESEKIIELDSPGSVILICQGGIGGRGNAALAHSRRTTPRFAQKGRPGESKTFLVSLKLIAEFGLIGLPNAGKSSLLNSLTNATAKIGDYDFTTLEPNLGVYRNKIIADIPGLIEGASEGKGLGIKFLKHIEKTKVLLHCIDSTSSDVKRDYLIVRNELASFNKDLLDKEEVILLTKTDEISDQELKAKQKKLTSLRKKVLPISILDDQLLANLRKILD
ncbi:hypothetical protein A2631_01560 [Candidatus Daviesbacteria bacterium RIFCSPHIGHO2_01_FULL_44_29]|uniref:GTPase Obg n=1 Tax=Candidatus Daviesbacteria bacterium RIFCSPHIGHO2_02_FULL_43_12 TaxID=1797776 RepID=A0A1F5KJM2_9BACT|nr:MAG: hypothetical protein A2631_01560 [Candidatus Daviesbacteria bacterium RIFCSPHIGHO2_01_FULL_44_29]OGE39063.1 MAG: hypothetical protein A3E86_00520 [Candidatus Daviesbacteria bacterium RIFCSPHIGHO2_12_FULL_47_45]OGE41092.1 MAG: hypothetical protein A3D25_00955 [Candidatus Daviesbacteria bacterium RIFCSPHIGHO2_02_FULL_43_12]OGE69291.1 MAG: hypothetical protein A3B55_02695 [Candidatus Daviesbacteria bacterium RIFCSPLOWO2_01_FULL_43_15]